MKIKKGKVEPKKDTVDLGCRNELKRALNNWFNLKLNDLPTIIRKLGIEEEDYSVFEVDKTSNSLLICVSTDKAAMVLELCRGEMTNPYPILKVHGEEERIYYVGRNVEIEKIYPVELTEEERKNGIELYKELMKSE